MLTSGEIGPRSTLHSAFCGIMILLGALITAVMFGDMALLMSNLNMRQSKF